MSKLIVVFFFCWCYLPLHTQIINIEALRINARDKNLSGIAEIDFGINKNKAGQTVSTGIEIGSRLNFDDRNSLTLLSGYHLSQFNDEDPAVPTKTFTNRAYAHLRYNRNLTKNTIWEVFSQFQWDEVQVINVRLLNGTGLRFQLMENDTASFYLGFGLMQEYEETNELVDTVTYNRDLRINTYVSGHMNLKPYLDFTYVLYFQPKPSQLGDFRLTTNLGLDIKLSDKVSLSTSLSLLLDSQPPSTIPKTQYYLKNGIKKVF